MIEKASENAINTHTTKLENRDNFRGGHINSSVDNHIVSRPNKRVLRYEWLSQYSTCYTYMRGRVGSFFIRWFENKDRNREERLGRIKNHCATLIQHYKSFMTTGVYEESSLQDNLSRFPYWRYLMEHLYTGHRKTYDELNKALKTNRMFKESSNDENYNSFRLYMDELITGNELAGAITLKGTCDHCIDFHDKKKIPQLKKELSELNFS
jgi:hypothetical protein